jgi:phage-related protein
VIIYQEADGSVPLLDWLDDLSAKARNKCLVKIQMLSKSGHDLRRPHCDLLERGIWELRARAGNVQYRILYFFHGRNIVVASHGFAKERQVPQTEIDRAIQRHERYTQNPAAHTYEGTLP